MLEQLDSAIGFAVVMLMLSLLITVFVQAASAAFDLRGRNLVWGLTKLFHQLDGAFAHSVKRDWNEVRSSVGKRIAEAVVMHPLVTHQTAGRAKTIRVSDLLTVLQDLATNPPRRLPEEARKVLESWTQRVPSPEALALARTVLERAQATMPGRSAEIRTLFQQAVGSTGRLQAGVECWFDEVMQRTSDVFQRWTKAITIAGALALAFGFHVDSIALYERISSSAGLRASLGSLVDETTRRAAELTALDASRVASAAATVRERHPNEAVVSTLAAMPGFGRCSEAEGWLLDKRVEAGVISEFAAACRREALQQLGGVGASLASLTDSLDRSGFALTSEDYTSLEGWWRGYWTPAGDFRLGHFLGVLATVFLLSLGGPFWYNALRQLCSLKPATAQKRAQDQPSTASVSAEVVATP
jgi:hypothetical protein